jgi:hypothetical protein
MKFMSENKEWVSVYANYETPTYYFSCIKTNADDGDHWDKIIDSQQ